MIFSLALIAVLFNKSSSKSPIDSFVWTEGIVS